MALIILMYTGGCAYNCSDVYRYVWLELFRCIEVSVAIIVWMYTSSVALIVPMYTGGCVYNYSDVYKCL